MVKEVALQLVEFNPKVDPKNTWRAPRVIATFLEMGTAGPIANKDAMVSRKDIMILIQRALVFLGSDPNTITLERRKIARSRFNPKLEVISE